MNRLIALLFCLLMITMPMAGCLGGDDSSDAPDEKLDDWNVHYAATAADLPTCDEDTNGRLYYVEADNQFQVCKTSGWSVIDIQGADGADGAAGADGQNGADGQDGADGSQGPAGNDGVNGQDGAAGTNGDAGVDGSDGVSTLIKLLSSTTCVNGGNTFEIGTDDNGDGILEVSEVVTTVDVCNGVDGQTGAQGLAGNDGQDGQTGAQGSAGNDGQDGQTGAQGPAGNDGQDGQTGAQGPAGNDGATALIATSSEPAGNNCANGGVKIEAGVDDNDNGQLDANEVDSTQYVCDGGSSATTTLTSISTPPTSMGCDTGSVISHGLDNGDGGGTAANGQLESGEVDHSTTICNIVGIAQTSMVAAINSGFSGSLIFQIGGTRSTGFNNELFFTANDGTHGYELWKYDGTNAPSMVADINPSGDSYPFYLTVLNNELYFRADDGVHGYELWKTDGTASGTNMFYDIRSGSVQSYIEDLFVFNNELYFQANDGTNGDELWKTDGTTAGTTMVADINPSGNSRPMALTIFNNELYFVASDGTHDYELWKYDGTNAPSMVADINSITDIWGSANSFNNNNDIEIVSFNNELYFSAFDGTNGYELWKTDGTTAGTTMVYDINSGSGSGEPFDLTVFNNELYFTANDGTNSYELWKTDGTTAGTTMVADNNPSGSGCVGELTLLNNELYFEGSDGTHGYELWKYDGTNAPSMVADINSGSSHSYPNDFIVFNNALYFEATDANNGDELWKTDGTTAGTTMVYDINPGSGDSNPIGLTVFNNALYFQAEDATNGAELWFHVDTGTGTTVTYS